MKKVRNSNIELLRIISMFMIVLSHYTVHNGISTSTIPLGFNRYLLEISTLGNIGVILFVLISGYFMINQKKLKLSKIISLYFQVIFYSLGIYLGFVLLNLEPFSIKTVVKSILPITYNQYWFMSVYFLMYLFSPFLNKFLNNLERKEHFNFIALMLIIFSVLSTLADNLYYSNELIQFIMFYSIGAYLKKYQENLLTKNNKINTIILLISSIILIISPLMFDLLKTKLSIFNKPAIYLLSRNSIFAILFSLSLFNFFIKKKEFSNKFINIVGSCTLGVYLIHDNNYVRDFLWKDLLKNASFIATDYLIVHLIISVFLVFLSCLLIEFIRKITIEKLTNKLSRKIDDFQVYVENKISLVYQK